MSWRTGERALTAMRPAAAHYVANTGPAYPVRSDVTGNAGGRRDFNQYGTQFHIAAPAAQ